MHEHIISPSLQTCGSAQCAHLALALLARNTAFLTCRSHTLPTVLCILTISAATSAPFSSGRSFCFAPVLAFRHCHSHPMLFCHLFGPSPYYAYKRRRDVSRHRATAMLSGEGHAWTCLSRDFNARGAIKALQQPMPLLHQLTSPLPHALSSLAFSAALPADRWQTLFLKCPTYCSCNKSTCKYIKFGWTHFTQSHART